MAGEGRQLRNLFRAFRIGRADARGPLGVTGLLPRWQGDGRGYVGPGVGGDVAGGNDPEDFGVFWKVGLVNGPSIGGDRPQGGGRLALDAEVCREVVEDAGTQRG